MSKSWVVEVQEAPDGDLYIELNDEILKESGFAVGDDVEWIDRGDGSWMLKKVEKQETEWVLVEAVSQFRMRYMVEVPKGKAEWAMDTVTMQEAKEFSQEHIGETIISHRVVSEEEAIAICDADNDYVNGKYGQPWTKEKKMSAFFTTWQEQQPEEN